MELNVHENLIEELKNILNRLLMLADKYSISLEDIILKHQAKLMKRYRYKMKIVVYCGASTGHHTIYQEGTIAMGAWIGKNNHTLVYGGGRIGLMGILADTVLKHKAPVIGVMPQFLVAREVAHPLVKSFYQTDTMSERKNKMIELGDAFIALPGGPGTLEEITEVISWARLGKNTKPCIFWNIDGYYNDIKHMYQHMVDTGFLTPDDHKKILFTESFEELDRFIQSYEPPQIRKYQK